MEKTELDLEELLSISAECIEHPEWDRVHREFRQEARPEVVIALVHRIKELEEGLRDAVCFMKDAKRVSIASRAIQLEAQLLGE